MSESSEQVLKRTLQAVTRAREELGVTATDEQIEERAAALMLEWVAKEAYHAYGGVTDWKNYQGLPMPKWEDLPPKIRDAWCAACARILTLR